jgi:sn-glycerol 3-phosphate transport system substrate-binding protein
MSRTRIRIPVSSRRARRLPRWRTGAAVFGALSLTATVAACSEPPTTGGGDVATGEDGEVELPDCPLDALEAADGPTDVTLWYGGLGGPTKDTMDDLAVQFNDSQGDVRVTASNQGASYEEVFRKYQSASSASSDQLPEIIYLEDVTLPAMVNGGQVLPAQACMEADGYDMDQIEPVIRSQYSVGGVLYPAYMNVSTSVLYYNKTHWARAGLDPNSPPQTLDDVYEAAKALKDAGISPKPVSLKLGHAFFTSWLNGVGVDVVNNENGRDGAATEATFDTPEARDLLEFLKKMNDEGLLNVFSATEGSIDHYLALANQQSSMLIETSTASSTIAEFLGGTLTPEDAGVNFDASSVDVADLVPGTGPFPGVDAPGQALPGGGVFYILNTSSPAQQAASWKYLEFMLQPDSAKQWHLNGGYLPIVKEVQDDPDVQEFWDGQMAGLLLHTAVDQLDQADPDRPSPLIGSYPDYIDAVQQAMEGILLDGQDVDSALATAQDTVTESLERYEGTG